MLEKLIIPMESLFLKGNYKSLIHVETRSFTISESS